MRINSPNDVVCKADGITNMHQELLEWHFDRPGQGWKRDSSGDFAELCRTIATRWSNRDDVACTPSRARGAAVTLQNTQRHGHVRKRG